MIQHDKHQYYFEKYLRKEMTPEESDAFNEKLSADASLRLAFEYYKLNREKLLSDLMAEHAALRKDNRLNKLIFLLISLTGITLTFAYYLNKSSQPTNGAAQPESKPFYTYIPFINWKQPTPNPSITKTDSTTVVVNKTDSLETIEPALEDDARPLNDVFLGDTLMYVYDKQTIFSWLARLDSINTQMVQLTDTNWVKPFLPKPKPKQPFYLVEFWQSPVGYKGYLVSENKIVVYGLDTPYKWTLYADTTLNVLYDKGETNLIADKNYHLLNK
ncbi:MAG: hypothetical protein MUE96_02510 [Bacteroidia bacterium]|jgi:hypothetical protein|nr:hypothetical protein [Bacteroidia bacterium]